HEQKVTALINNLFAMAEAEHDYATRGKLDWFVSEQVEEEDTARGIIDRLRLIGNDGLALYTLDKEFEARVYNVPSPLANA
ncbi:MAG: ferritin, partial [Muribaculaceae bacterium]|nr:ferritin [Muribaculaceae bacterium]